MSEEEKELIKEFKEELNKDLKDIENVNDTFLMVTMHNIEIIVNLIEKQDKVIDEMAKNIENEIGISSKFAFVDLLEFENVEEIKEYFYRKVKNK